MSAMSKLLAAARATFTGAKKKRVKRRKAKKPARAKRARVAKVKKMPVIIRVERDGELVAIFPDQAGTNDPNTMTCYSTIGGHSSCDAQYSGTYTKPASKVQVAEMLRELVRTGYKRNELKVIARPSSHHRRERMKEIGR